MHQKGGFILVLRFKKVGGKVVFNGAGGYRSRPFLGASGESFLGASMRVLDLI
jgi:hypothetical protein